MRRPAIVLAAVAAAALALAPALADARPGGSRSLGSRGSQTYSPPPSTSTAPGTARPMERSMTEPGRSAMPQAQRPPIGQANPAGGFFSRSPFMAGMLGGLLGVGLGGLLFGHGLFGGLGGMGFAGFLGLLLQIGLVVLLVRLAMGWFRRRAGQPAMAGIPQGMARQMDGGPNPGPGPRGGMAAGGGAAAGAALALEKADFDAFEGLLKDINAAWSRQDLAGLQRLATPEMVQYFADDLADLSSRGLRNETRDVTLDQGDLAEAWREGRRDYATVAMRFSMIDVTRRLSDGAVVEGDPARRTQAVEIWTFARSQGGAWQLSAIQQTG